MNILNEGLFKITLGSLTIKMAQSDSFEGGIKIIANENNEPPFFADTLVKGESKHLKSGEFGSNDVDINASITIDKANNVFFDGSFSEGKEKPESHKFQLKIGLPSQRCSFPDTITYQPSVNCKYPATIGTLTLNAQPEASDDSTDKPHKKVKFDIIEYEDGSHRQYGPDEPVDEGKYTKVDTKGKGKKHQPDFTGNVSLKNSKAGFDGNLEFEGNLQVYFYFDMNF